MHEMGIAASVLDLVRQDVPVIQGPLVRRVTVRVGELAGVQADSLRFCFEALVAGTPYQSAALAIEQLAAMRACRGCGTEFAAGVRTFTSKQSSPATSWTSRTSGIFETICAVRSHSPGRSSSRTKMNARRGRPTAFALTRAV